MFWHWLNPLMINLALYLSIVSSGFLFTRIVHLHGTAFTFLGRSINFHIWFFCRENISTFTVSLYLALSLLFIAALNVSEFSDPLTNSIANITWSSRYHGFFSVEQSVKTLLVNECCSSSSVSYSSSLIVSSFIFVFGFMVSELFEHSVISRV